MKKYLLTALLGVFVLVGFTSASSIDCSISSCSPSSVSISTVSCVEGDGDMTFSQCSIPVSIVGGGDLTYKVYLGSKLIYDTTLNNMNSSSVDNLLIYDAREIEDSESFESLYAGNFNNLIISNLSFSSVSNDSFVISSSSFVSSSDSGGGSNSGSLLPDGVGNLSGIISSLSTTLNEFIPYLVYVGLGIISALIGFVAIKRLINWIRAKIFSSFSSGRRRR